MSDEKPRVYTEAEVAAKIAEPGLADWYMDDGWLRRKYNTDGWPTTLMLVNADRLPLRGGLAPRRPVRHLGQGLGQAEDPLGGRDHRQGLRPGAEDRGGRALAARAGRPARGDAQQVRPGKK